MTTGKKVRRPNHNRRSKTPKERGLQANIIECESTPQEHFAFEESRDTMRTNRSSSCTSWFAYSMVRNGDFRKNKTVRGNCFDATRR